MILDFLRFFQDLQELQQQLLEAAKDNKEVTSHDLGREQGTPFDLSSLYNSPAFLKDQSVTFLGKPSKRWHFLGLSPKYGGRGSGSPKFCVFFW